MTSRTLERDSGRLGRGEGRTVNSSGQRKPSKTNKMAEGEAKSSCGLQFSGNEKEVIERKLDVSTEGLDRRKDINDFYEISRCVDVIKTRGFNKVRTSKV